jgi:hypothetical protein
MDGFDIRSPRFARYILSNAALETLATGFRWIEGPVWMGDANCLLFQDLPNDRTMRWIEGQGVSVYRAPSHYANGQTRDRQGRLIACSHRGRCLYRTEYDGRVTTLIDRHAGKRLNSPNDVVVKSDGSIWFTDPLYGISNDYEWTTGVGTTAGGLPSRTGNGRRKNRRERFRRPQWARLFARRNTTVHSRNRKPNRAFAAPIHSRFQCWTRWRDAIRRRHFPQNRTRILRWYAG